MGRNLTLCVVLALFLTGCAVTRSTEAPAGSTAQVYHLTAEQADHVLQMSMAEQFPGYAISSLALPNKGYSVQLHFLLDYHTVSAYAVQKPDGYAFEVNSSGTMVLQGELKARGLFKKIVAHAAATTQG